MRARWAVPAALAVVLACAPARAELRSRTRDLGAVSPVVSLLALEQGGSQDWGAGIPSPTIDCAAVGTSSVAALQCSGATPSFAGPGQTAAGSPWWYRGDTAVRPSIALNGSTEYWDLGNAVDANGGGFALCAQVRADSVSGVAHAVSKYVSGGYQFSIYRSGAVWYIGQYRTDGSGNAVANAAVALGAYQTVCGSLTAVGAGSSVLRGNVDGYATSRSDASIPDSSSATVVIGGASGGAGLWTGSIRRVAIWTGADAPTSAAQLAQLVATQWGLAADKPAGTVATHARTDSTLCCPFSDAECYWVGPGVPCIHAPTYQGWASGGAVAGGAEVYGPGANALGYSETFANAAWVKSAGVTAADASASCPMSPLAGTRMSLVTTDGEADQIAQDAATTPGRAVWLARATGDSACGVTFGDATGDGAQSVALTDGPLRYWSGGTGQTGLSVARPVGGCARWCMWLAQATAAVHPVPPRSTPGASPYSGTASTATTLTVPVPAAVTDARGAVYAQWISANTATNARLLGFSGSATPAAVLSATSLQSWDGANLISLSGAWSASTASWFRGEWSGSVKALTTPSASSSGAYDGAWLGSVVYVGSNAGTGDYINGLVSRVALCNRGGSACR